MLVLKYIVFGIIRDNVGFRYFSEFFFGVWVFFGSKNNIVFDRSFFYIYNLKRGKEGEGGRENVSF